MERIRILPDMVLPGTVPVASPPARPPSRSRRKVALLAVVGVVCVLLFLRSCSSALSGSSYEFLKTQGDEPVTWNHCQAIRFSVNPKGAPEHWEEVVAKAVADVTAKSGFVFRDLGTTTKTQLIGSRYEGNEWEPVLILWSDRYQDGALGGGVIGLGGPGMVDVNGRERYVVGKVSLDSSVREPHAAQMVLEHELGHVLGLDHTSDESQLMYAAYHGQEGLGKGDVNGLQRLHDVPCD